MFKNNIRYEGHAIAKTVPMLLLMLVATVLCALVLGGRLDVLVEKLMQSPPEVIALFGIYDIKEKHISLMIFYMVVIILNIVAISKVAGSAVEAVKEDEENGSIRFFMHQTYSCDQIWIGKALMAIVSALVQWWIYILSMMLMVWLICYRCDLAIAGEMSKVLTIGVRGSLFVILAVGVCLLYSLMDELTMTYEYFVSTVFSCSFIIGNLYKVCDMLAVYTASGKMEQTLHKFSDICEKLRILFPFTLLNVFNVGKQPLPDFTYGLYAGIVLFVFVAYGYIYRRDAA